MPLSKVDISVSKAIRDSLDSRDDTILSHAFPMNLEPSDHLLMSALLSL